MQKLQTASRPACYAGYPDLYMQFSKKVEFVFQPDWYRGVEYPKEQERGYASNEDLYVPGYFEMDIKKGESIVFSASTSACKTTGLKKLFPGGSGRALTARRLLPLPRQRSAPVPQPHKERRAIPESSPVIRGSSAAHATHSSLCRVLRSLSRRKTTSSS